ncbi:MAG: putative metal-dependent phosphoesterase family [Dehalococcoidia bacterium]|nr:putative metal-dependent phosphoesterase family [Dehalococcoidia bacterium]
MHVDLHLHTTASDGRFTPTELVTFAGNRGMRIIAVTDHDSTEGLAEALDVAKSYPQLTIIPGIELSTDIPRNEVHILGYFMDYHNPSFQEKLEEFREARTDRGERMVEKLASLGIHISWERVLEIAQGGSVGRPHVAQAMLEGGYITSISEAFDRYIGRNGPAYADRHKMTPPEAIAFLKGYGGVAVLAHPKDILENLDPILDDLQGAGLVGMEVHYQGYPPELVADLLANAESRGLIPCGGSDFHGMGARDEFKPGDVDVPIESAQRLMAVAQEVRRTAR